MPREEWRPVRGFEGLYDISSWGRVRAPAKTNVRGHRLPAKMLRATIDCHGYPYHNLRKDGAYHRRKVHVLVLETFIKLRPIGMVARHYPDRNPMNNFVDNLSWSTQRENLADRVEHGTHDWGERHGSARLTLAAVERIKRDPSLKTGELAREYGVAKTTISSVKHGRNWKHVEVLK